VDGLVRPRRTEGGDVQTSREGRVDGRFDDRDVLARDERDDMRRHDRIRDVDGKQPERRDVLRGHDPNVRSGDGHDGSRADASFAIGQRHHDHGTVGRTIG
jgi:hypothetical protein